MIDKAKLLKLFQERALQFGTFTLASGKTSSYYLDGKQITLYSDGLRLVAEGLLDLLSDVEFDAIGGMSIGADPIVGAVLTVAAERNRELAGFMVRKEPKGHGTKKYLEGPITESMKVVVLDDVVTTGKSTLEAIQRTTDFGCEVVHAVGVVDRMEGGAENFRQQQIPFTSLLKITDFGIEAPSV